MQVPQTMSRVLEQLLSLLSQVQIVKPIMLLHSIKTQLHVLITDSVPNKDGLIYVKLILVLNMHMLPFRVTTPLKALLILLQPLTIST